jgi:cyclopropane fatty-acyl-phospholipid synthase-like methyltransferase
MQVAELVKAARVLGPNHLVRLARARSVGVINIVRGHYTTRVISTLFNVGLFDELVAKGSVSAEEFAATHDLDPEILKVLCDYLFELRILDRRGERYILDSKGKTIVEMLGGLFDVAYAYEDVLHHLEALLKREMHYGHEVHRKDEAMARGSGAGGKLLMFPLVIDHIRESGFQRPLDLACGDAAFLIPLCETLPSIRAYGVDISPEAVAYAQRRVQERNLQDRLQIYAQDMFEIQQMAERMPDVDVVTSFYGFQELLFGGKERVLGLFERYRETFPKASFVICEIPKYSPEELRKQPRGMLEYQLYHALTRQRLATREEWMSLWRQAGFRRIEERYLSFARTVVYTLAW